MFELNAVTALPVGAVAAAMWGAVGIGDFYAPALSRAFLLDRKWLVWGVAAVAFAPALFLASIVSMMLMNVTVRPGRGITYPWRLLWR